MRFLSLILLGLVLAAPAWAQENTATPTGDSIGHVFGSTTCSQRFSCSNASMSAAAPALATMASACIRQFYGYGNTPQFFDNTSGLDGNNCLTPLPNIIPNSAGHSLAAHCCVTTLNGDVCAFNCGLMSSP
jgi:hypothetical protein